MKIVALELRPCGAVSETYSVTQVPLYRISIDVDLGSVAEAIAFVEHVDAYRVDLKPSAIEQFLGYNPAAKRRKAK